MDDLLILVNKQPQWSEGINMWQQFCYAVFNNLSSNGNNSLGSNIE